jgi:hypothetical protein
MLWNFPAVADPSIDFVLDAVVAIDMVVRKNNAVVSFVAVRDVLSCGHRASCHRRVSR